MLITREVYIYHFFGTLPFLIFALVYALRYLYETFWWGKRAVWAFTGVCVLAFVAFYPAITGIAVPRIWLEIVRWNPLWPL